MASTVLPNGIIIPEKYSRDWYNDLYHNWQELDNLLGGGTPKDGMLTIQKNGDTVGTFSANQATNETIDITVPDVNDGTLTIQQNGTTVDTFTANSSTDKTVDITVPTKTSDLTNDSGFITEDNTKIPLAGSNQISGSLIPATTDAYDLGSSSYQWNNAYIKSLTINGVVCGDILTHNVSEFANVSSNQTIAGVKTFSSNVIIQGSRKVTCNLDNSFIELDGGTTWGKGGSIVLSGQDRSSYSNSVLIVSKSDTSTDILQYQNGELKPLSNNTNNPSLGTSTNKWKLFNGINPGALSLPGDAYIDIDTTNYAWGSNFTFTPDYDGYCFLNIGSSSYSRIISLKTGRGEYYFSNQTEIFCFTFPVYKGKLVTILTTSSGTESVIPTIRVFSCQGNV